MMAAQGNFDSEVFEVGIESPPAEKCIDENSNQFPAELVEAGIRELHRNLGKGTPPTLLPLCRPSAPTVISESFPSRKQLRLKCLQKANGVN